MTLATAVTQEAAEMQDAPGVFAEIRRKLAGITLNNCPFSPKAIGRSEV
jgi:hypothetical protein